MDQTFGKAERLNKRDFRYSRWTKSGRTHHFLLFRSKNEGPARRFGVVVSRKVKGAARRNRIKRLLREFFRQNKPLFEESMSHSVRVTGMPESVTWKAVSAELRLLLSKVVRE
jgi:ribonuclease P protein component